MEIDKDTLVYVLENNGFPPKACWGIVTAKLADSSFRVKIEKILLHKPTEDDEPVCYPDEIPLNREQLIPIIQLPHFAVKKGIKWHFQKYFPEIMARILTDFLRVKEQKPEPLPDNTLVLVLGPAGVSRWGILERTFPDGSIEVNMGRDRSRKINVLHLKSLYSLEKLIIPKDQIRSKIIPILRLSKASRSPRNAIFNDLERFAAFLILRPSLDGNLRLSQMLMRTLSGVFELS
ncbi:MAG: hypothetical protein WC845_01545 [Candidatus Staskawiczbacteria bacterium]|jgi:hypothetical protein